MSTIGSRRDNVMNGWSKNFVRVAPPTAYSGVGNALRQAFAAECSVRASDPFDDLLDHLDQLDSESGLLQS